MKISVLISDIKSMDSRELQYLSFIFLIFYLHWQTEIEAALERVCNILPSSVKQECDTLIKTYFPELIQLLLQLSPKDICSSLGLCASQGKLKGGFVCGLGYGIL